VWNAITALNSSWRFFDRETLNEIADLEERLEAFDTLIEQELRRKREARRQIRKQEFEQAVVELEQPQPRPGPPDYTPWREIRFTIPVDDVLPVPVRDADDAHDGASHFIQADIDRQADTIVSRGYTTMGRRRNRRYEGYRS
jgi:hypothetical protein